MAETPNSWREHFLCSSVLSASQSCKEADMRILTGAIAGLALAASSAAQAQIYVADPPPPPVVYAPAPPVVVAPPAVYAAPTYVEPAYGAPAYVAPGATTVNPYTGRTCTIEPSGYRWCWTP
jgi:hypothetical protein